MGGESSDSGDPSVRVHPVALLNFSKSKYRTLIMSRKSALVTHKNHVAVEAATVQVDGTKL